MLPSAWKDAVITFGTDPNNSAEVDMGGYYEFLTVIIPTLSNASTTTVHISDESGGTFVPMYRWDEDTATNLAHTTADADTTMAMIWRIGGARFLKVVCADNQSANTTFRVRGFNRD